MEFLPRRDSRIILSLDMTDPDLATSVVRECSDVVDAIKVGYPLLLAAGLPFMLELKRRSGLSVIADLKVADIPVTNNKIVALAASYGADAVMVHGFAGSDSILECMRAGSPTCAVIVVTELTSPGGLEFTSSHAAEFASLARDLGCPAIQAPGTRPDKVAQLRAVVGPRMGVVCCGIGAQGGQFRRVLDAGADYGIIGRAIYSQPSPRKAALSFREESYN